ncbi:MAG TPA: Ig-like domain-containing protein, partial [Blastocatellia bacterium]|nr:Ig-like domain-containing protein [Blastocatellia bacterium]
GWDPSYGWGRVNAAKAVSLAGGSSVPPPIPVPDTTPPSVTITSPANGSKAGSKVSITVNATDDRAVVKVDLYIDGILLDSSTQSPFSFRWDTRRVPRGQHTIHCQAYDAAGNVGTSPVVTVRK